MEFQEYFSLHKQINEILLDFISSDDETESNYAYQKLADLIESKNIVKDREEFQLLLKLISVISINYLHGQGYSQRIEKIILQYEDHIKQTFSNSELFKIFQNNKRVLLFLFEHEILKPDESIMLFIDQRSEIYKTETKDNKNDYDSDYDYDDIDIFAKKRCFFYDIYFYPELKNLFDEKRKKLIEDKISKLTDNDFDLFIKRRKIGENESKICEMIRQDSVEDFIKYINRNNISPKSVEIKQSIFETNTFLIKRKPSLIEYAAFYGSIEIFQYLLFNKFKLKPSLWLYAIHGGNNNLIRLLDENHAKTSNQMIEKCLKEAIKCHHNDIANFVINNLMDEDENKYNIAYRFNENIYNYSFHYCNFCFFPDDFNNKFSFFYACKFNYYTLVNLYIKYKRNYLNATIVNIFLIFKSNFNCFLFDVISTHFFTQFPKNSIFIKFHIKLLNEVKIY